MIFIDNSLFTLQCHGMIENLASVGEETGNILFVLLLNQVQVILSYYSNSYVFIIFYIFEFLYF